MTNQCKIDAQKKTKSRRQNCPKINEHRSKNRSRDDLWPLILRFFGAMTKKRDFFDTPPNAKKIRKIGVRSAQETLSRPRGLAKGASPGGLGCWGGLARDQIQDTELQETGNKRQETRKSYKKQARTRNRKRRDDLTRLWAGGLANLIKIVDSKLIAFLFVGHFRAFALFVFPTT